MGPMGGRFAHLSEEERCEAYRIVAQLREHQEGLVRLVGMSVFEGSSSGIGQGGLAAGPPWLWWFDPRVGSG